jgi:hypothetical protein
VAAIAAVAATATLPRLPVATPRAPRPPRWPIPRPRSGTSAATWLSATKLTSGPLG